MKMATAKQDVRSSNDFATSDFAIGDISFVLDMFAEKIYSDRPLAVVRELSCNAWDSHKKVGNEDKPFVLHLPTTLEPWFEIRDYGTGLTEEEVRGIYAGIGISTKRDSNDYVGCFGVGSLTPYSMVDSFTVASYVDGEVKTYCCYRDEDRKPVVSLLSTEETSEENGVQITFTCNKFNDFKDAAKHLFRWWVNMPIINSKEVVEYCQESKKSMEFVGDNYMLSSSYGTLYAVMGGIPYRVRNAPYYISGMLKFEIGDLEFDTSRENLVESEENQRKINVALQKAKKDIQRKVKEKAKSLKTDFEKLMFNNQNKYNQLIEDLEAVSVPAKDDSRIRVYVDRRGRISRTSCQLYNFTDYVNKKNKFIFVEDKPKCSGRIHQFARDSEYIHVFAAERSQLDTLGVPDHLVVAADTLPKVKRAPRKEGTRKVEKVFLWDTKHSGRGAFSKVDLPTDKVCYVEVNNWNIQNGYTITQTVKFLESLGVKLPKVYALKTAFLKTKQFKNGDFVEFEDFVKEKLAENLPEVVYTKNKHVERLLKIANYVSQDELDKIVSKYQSTKEYLMCQSTITVMIGDHEIEFSDECEKMADKFFAKYPMLNFVNHVWGKEDKKMIADYIGGKNI